MEDTQNQYHEVTIASDGGVTTVYIKGSLDAAILKPDGNIIRHRSLTEEEYNRIKDRLKRLTEFYSAKNSEEEE